MSNTIERRLFKNTSVGIVSFILTLCQTIVLVPFLLKHWGSGNYGLWLALMAGFNLLQTLDLGHQNYIGNRLNLQFHTSDSEFRRTLGSSLLMAYLLGFIEFGLCLLLIATKKISPLLGVPEFAIMNHHLDRALLFLMAMWMTFGSFGGIVVRIMIPAGMLYESQLLGIITRLVQFFSIIIVVINNGTIVTVCLWYAATQSIVSIFVLLYIKSILPALYPWWATADWSEGFIGLKKSIVLTVNNLGQQASNSGLILFVSWLFFSSGLAEFTTMRTLTNTAGAVTIIFITALLPDVVRFHAKHEATKLLDSINVNWFISGLFVQIGTLLVLPIVEPIYRAWTKGYLTFNPLLFFWMIISISFMNFGSGLNQYLGGINDLKAQTAINISRLVILIAIGYVVGRVHGIIGIGIACVVSEIFASVILPIAFVNSKLRLFSARLSPAHVLVALIPPVTLLFAGCLMLFVNIDFAVLTLIFLPVFLLNYYVNWNLLGSEVQCRIKKFGGSFTNPFYG